jgi:hypothetical protein
MFSARIPEEKLSGVRLSDLGSLLAWAVEREVRYHHMIPEFT